MLTKNTKLRAALSIFQNERFLKNVLGLPNLRNSTAMIFLRNIITVSCEDSCWLQNY